MAKYSLCEWVNGSGKQQLKWTYSEKGQRQSQKSMSHHITPTSQIYKFSFHAFK